MKHILASLLAPALVALAASSCGGKAAGPPGATANTSDAPLSAGAALESRSGSSATGTAEFHEKDGLTEIVIRVQGATPGMRGVHVHDKGDCSAPDAESAGPHFSPDDHQHGPPAPGSHAGDLGNVEVGPDGSGSLTLTSTALTVRPGTGSVIGRAIILHGGTDDMQSDPGGKSGPRVACGVIAPR